MKVLNINSYYFSSKVHNEIAPHYPKDMRYDSFVALEKNKTQKNEVRDIENVHISYCFNKFDKFNFYRKNKKIYQALMNSKLNHDYDVVHAHSLFTNGAIARKYAADKNLPYVVTIRSTDIVTFFKRMIHLRKLGISILNDAAKIIVLSSKTLEQLKKYVPESTLVDIEKKTLIIPNGINSYWLENINPIQFKQKPQKEVKLLHVGDVSKRKNITTTVKALKILNDKNNDNLNFKLNIVGKIKNQSIYDNIIKEDNVEYFGMVNKEELKAIYRGNDIFVLPSLNETFGLVYPEAMSQGLPVIYTVDEGFDGQFPEGKVGYSVRSKSEEDITKAVLLVLDNYEQLSKSSLEKCGKFDWSLIANEIYKMYIELGGK